MQLARFNHHPDPAIDFCIEVEDLEAMAFDRRVGVSESNGLEARIRKAMEFRVGGDLNAILTKGALRELEQEFCQKDVMARRRVDAQLQRMTEQWERASWHS